MPRNIVITASADKAIIVFIKEAPPNPPLKGELCFLINYILVHFPILG
jgi:hypothetical protein